MTGPTTVEVACTGTPIACPCGTSPGGTSMANKASAIPASARMPSSGQGGGPSRSSAIVSCARLLASPTPTSAGLPAAP
eukprot:scaffold22332_cov72-Phaeocystis_antarctica.AAC.1